MKRILTTAVLLGTLCASAALAATAVVHTGDLSSGGPCSSGTCTYAYTHPVWFFYNDETDVLDNSLGAMVLGPGTPLTGRGSAQISVTGTQRRNLATYQFGGTLLSSITAMKYTTYNPSAGNGGGANRSGYLNFNVDFTGAGAFVGRLAYLPSLNTTVVPNTWKEWDTISGGSALWQYPNRTWPAPLSGSGNTPKTWSQIVTAYPSARILATDPWLGVRVGEPYNNGYTEDIDNFTFGTGAGTTTFDFEPGPFNVIAPAAPATCIAVAHPCVTAPVGIARTDAIGVRGYTVTLQLSANLALCNGLTSDVTEGTYLSGVGGTNFQVVSNGGGSYTVDCAILGATAGATAASGNLFNLSLKNVGADGTGTVTITSVGLRDPNNATIFADAGAPASITIDNTNPVAVSDLAATQVSSGNDADGTTKIALTFTAPVDAAQVEVYRAGFGNYPEYDDGLGAGSVPAAPSYPPVAPWALTGVTATGQTDEVANRDFWYYVVFSKDACGNVSLVSNRTSGTLNYYLGDVSAACAGNNLVNTQDISFLGSHYGITLSEPDPLGCLDVGPTTDFSVHARPTTDNRVDFEDLILFAINYGTVSMVSSRGTGHEGAIAGTDVVTVDAPSAVTSGETFTATLRLQGAGDLQGISAQLGWNHDVAVPVSVQSGAMLDEQNGVALSAGPGEVDAALLGTREQGLSGTGNLAIVTFRATASGNPGVGLSKADGRNAANAHVALGLAGVAATPRVTQLMGAAPNPFQNRSVLAFSLAKRGPVQLAIYSVDGRKLRTLANDTREAGTYRFAWDGRDDRGNAVQSGMFFVRLSTGEGRFSKTLLRIQ